MEEAEDPLLLSENEFQAFPWLEKAQLGPKPSTPLLADFSSIRRYATYDQWFNAQTIGTKIKLCSIPFTMFLLVCSAFVVIGVTQPLNYSTGSSQIISVSPTLPLLTVTPSIPENLQF